MSVLAFRVSVAHLLIHSVCSSIHPLFSLSFPQKQLWGIYHVLRSWEILGTILSIIVVVFPLQNER